MEEQTLVLLKPDCVERQLVGHAITRYEQKGLRVAAMKLFNVSSDRAKELYQEHDGKSFFNDLITYITHSPIVAMVLTGKNAIKIARAVNGATNPAEALPGTIRGDFGVDVRYNLVHASDSEASANREISVFFKKDDLLSYDITSKAWL